MLASVLFLVFWIGKSRLLRQVTSLNTDMLQASRDSSVGRRLTVPENPETAALAHTVNRLFDAISERDHQIQGRDQLFKDFARTLPEIVMVHKEKIYLANESAAALIGLEAAQLVGRDIVDLVKPAYRALFRKTMAKRLAGEKVPRRLEIQLINGDQSGLWVEAQSAVIVCLQICFVTSIRCSKGTVRAKARYRDRCVLPRKRPWARYRNQDRPSARGWFLGRDRGRRRFVQPFQRRQKDSVQIDRASACWSGRAGRARLDTRRPVRRPAGRKRPLSSTCEPARTAGRGER